MLAAGNEVFKLLMNHYGKQARLLILCGGGNNGGDGYVVAKLALEQGMSVTVKAVKQPGLLQGDAFTAYQDFVAVGGEIQSGEALEIKGFDVVVDALLGIGVRGAVRAEVAKVIEAVNQSLLPVVAVDLPSGLCSDTGRVLGVCIQAKHTVTFIGIKQGLVTGQARRYVGVLHYASLGIKPEFDQVQSAQAHLDSPSIIKQIASRDPCAHKGLQGKALLVGGDYGLGGAILIATRACLKSGAGLTACLTEQRNISVGLVTSPEAMFANWKLHALEQRLTWCDAIALGPGLGQGEHALQLFSRTSRSNKVKVLDADALKLLARESNIDNSRIITPHPGEAAELLACTIAEIESDRYRASRALQTQYGGVVVLKGAGTIVTDSDCHYVCRAGNAGMATGGMGDALSGILVALLARGIEITMAARLGVMLHSHAADLNVSAHGMCGLTASDVVDTLREAIFQAEVMAKDI
ncbi:hypothetical protein VII00023_05177 [Vibrio ichthyoenteri ATCC 700023]|uniref:ADP-dependent (S)-NAD(P)H-hydrate dehydratase n=1 Tax=Vibrio ichthyoenteri ATCC 700023 TaxID=870968 RepID=F9S106_9VIBR|nr:hypothetical protein VII00023_05177 [Vibrio ichthyoenteri ATCC 700023]